MSQATLSKSMTRIKSNPNKDLKNKKQAINKRIEEVVKRLAYKKMAGERSY